MANSFFRFKQFSVEQGQAAMKVCTDSCILGAWANVENAGTVIDIGTGTGLLALMAAQRSEAQITAIEINDEAAAQARHNFEASPWKSRITLVNSSIQDFAKTNKQPFEVIICNPPFFQASLKSPDPAKTTAKHTSELPFSDLLAFVQANLQPEGSFYLLLPPAEATVFRQMAALKNLCPVSELLIYTQLNGKHLRTIFQYRFQIKPLASSTLYIRNSDQTYSLEFCNLLKPYYLNL